MEPSSQNQSGGQVAELQGLYGAFSFPERLLQKIWARGDFDLTAARCADGREVVVVHPGKWNRLGGPDFLGARLCIGGREISGDVELHLHASDWAAHGHAADPAYANVVLHVVLFDPGAAVTVGENGRAIPVMGLLPLLHHGLEEYAADDAVEGLAGRSAHRAIEELGRLDTLSLDALLAGHARRRWDSKVRYAGLRIGKLGWAEACHQTALEILGYRFNRSPMLAVAARYPLAAWAKGDIDPGFVHDAESGRWICHGVRPANHPRTRLRQYAAWCAARPNWPDLLADPDGLTALAASSPSDGAGAWRRNNRQASVRRHMADKICAGNIGGTRWDNMVADGFMPLLAARPGPAGLYVPWGCWQTGDVPAEIVRVLRILGVFGGRDRPVSQGPVQGLLGWMLEHEARAAG